MRRFITGAAATAIIATLAGGTGLASASTHPAGARSSPVPGARMINLHQAYKRALPHVKNAKVSGIVYALGRRPKAAAAKAAKAGAARAGASCSEPNCPLTYHGGAVQHSPHVYLLLWGPGWSNASEGGYASDLEGLLAGLGREPSDSWSLTLSGYSDGTGFPAFFGSVFMGAWNDTSTPPTGATQAQLAAEADAFANAHSITDRTDAQIVVATEAGTCPAGFYAPGCAGGTGYYCAWHSSSGEPYINMPYVLDAGTGCGEDFVNSNGTYDGLNMVFGHEFAETVTDTYVGSGWIDPSDPNGGEIGDKCAWRQPYGNVLLFTGWHAMQSLWSNATNSCVLSVPFPDQLSVTNPGEEDSVHPSRVSVTIPGSSSTGSALAWHWSGLPGGLSAVGGNTGLTITGNPVVGTYQVTVQDADTTGALATASFTWYVEPSCLKLCK